MSYQEWQVERSLPPSSITTSLWNIWRSDPPVGITAPNTLDHSMPNQIHTPAEYLHRKRCTPSTQMRPSRPWLTLCSMVNETHPFKERYNDSTKPMKGWQTLPKIWQGSKNSIGTHNGRSITHSIHWPTPMCSATLNHAS